MRRTQQIDDDVARVEVTGARGSDDAAQTVLRLGAALRAIAARDLTIHDDWAQRLAKQALKAYADEHSGRGVVVRDYGREVQQLAERISDKVRARIESLTVVA